MTQDKTSKKRFDRFFIIILIIAFLTAILTFTTTRIENEQASNQDSIEQKKDTSTHTNH